MSLTKDQELSLEAGMDQGFTKTFLNQQGLGSDNAIYGIVKATSLLSIEYNYFPKSLTASTIVWGLLQLMMHDLPKPEEVVDSDQENYQNAVEVITFLEGLYFWLRTDFRPSAQT